ncbi:P-loop NTPase family protein [Granulicella arctica]|uniref:recombinase RecA n=1 Tax=Granulicella arctica TaxID=940613 RepID=UPI0021E0DC44|nr:recombinase RecA [Granulicella arctica]
MRSAFAVRAEIESNLANRIPSALTPAPCIVRPVAPTCIGAIDELLNGGLPLGAITEIVGPECSGGVSLALSFVAGTTQAGKVCAWIDVSDSLHPESAVGAGIEPTRLLWVRCGVQAASHTHGQHARRFVLSDKYLIPKPIKQGLHGGGFGSHPRGEVKGLSEAVSGLLHRAETINPRCAEPIRRVRTEREAFEPPPFLAPNRPPVAPAKPWGRIEQALKVTDLILQGGGFSVIVLDMGSIAPEYVSRVPLATWFRYRAAAEQSQASILLLTQHPAAKSSAGLVLRMHSGDRLQSDRTVFTGIRHRVEVTRQRFAQAPGNIVPLRKLPHRANAASWQTRTSWTGRT